MKIPKLLFIDVFVGFIALTSCFVIDNQCSVTISYKGFGIDSKGTLYIGKDSVIEKVNDGKVMVTISPKTSREYAFAIKEDDTILLSTASTVYTLDLSGNAILSAKPRTKEP